MLSSYTTILLKFCWSCSLKKQWFFVNHAQAYAKLSHIVQCSLPSLLKWCLENFSLSLLSLAHMFVRWYFNNPFFPYVSAKRFGQESVDTQSVSCSLMQVTASMLNLCVHSNIFVEDQFFSKSSTVHRSQVLLNSVRKCSIFLFIIPLIFVVGYQIRISQDFQVVNLLLRSWEVSFSDVILHIGTGVQWEVLVSWLFFCLIVLLQNSFLKWFLSAWSSIIHRHSCRYSQPEKRCQIAEYSVR